MKLIKLFLLCLLGAFAVSGVAGQSDVGINMLTQNSGVVNQGGTVFLEVTINSNGPTAGIPAGSVVVSIFVPSIVQIQSSGHILPPGWQDLGDFGTGGSEYYICNGSDAIPAGASRTLLIAIQGITVGGPSTISGNISLVDCDFNPVVLPGDSPNNNGGTASIKVQTAPACSLAVSASAGTIACNGGTTTLTATATGGNGVVEYSLNGGAFQSGNTFTISATGSPYTVTAREVNNTSCTATSNTVTVTQPSAITASAAAGAIAVFGGTTTLTVTASGGTGALQYSLNGGAFQAGNTFTVNAVGSPYTITVKDANNCTVNTNSVTVTQPSAITASASAGTIACFGGTTTLTVTAAGGTGALQYSLNGGAFQSGNTFTVNAAGSPYTVTVRDANVCTATTNTVTVTQPTQLTATASSTPVTTIGGSDGTATANPGGGTPSYSYLWSPGGQTTQTATGLSAGTYSVTITDANGCTATATTTVGSPACSISASAAAGTIACPGGTATLTVTVTGGTAPIQYSLNGGAFQPGNTFTVGAGTYTVSVKDANNCTATTNTVTIAAGVDNINPTITAPANVTVCTNSGCTATGVLLGTPVTADNCIVASVTNNAPAAFPLGNTTVTWTVTDGSGHTATATQTVTVNDCTAPAIYVNQSGLLPGVTGSSSSASPYLLPVKPGVKFTSILTTPDAVGGYAMAGIPDGLGAFDNNDGTFTLLMNHELVSGGAVRAHGGTGTFVSKWIINKSTLQVISGADLMQQVYGWNTGTQSSNTTTSVFNFSRFCSADLPSVSAFYNAATGLGTQARIYMHGEENNPTGWQLGSVANGPDAGKSYILGKFNLTTNGSGLTGVGNWENALANPFAQNKTIVIANSDGGTGIMTNAVAVYVGTKTNTGSEVDKAGLTNGTLSFVNVTGNAAEIVNTTTRATNIVSGTPFTLSGTTATTFSRPEDGTWNPANPSKYYFVTTDQLDQVADGIGTQVGRSRLWRLNFTDITNPALGGTIDLVLNGTEGHNMLDNMTADKCGHLILQEDVGNAAHNGKIWQYTIATGALVQIAKHDPARFGDRVGGVTTAPTAPFTTDEESSGIIDVSDILGKGMFLTSDQAHYPLASPAIEGGQLLLMFNPESVCATGTAQDTIRACSGTGVNLGTPATADNCSVASVTNDAPSTFPVGTTTVTWTVTDGSGNTATATQVVIVSDLAVTATSTPVTTIGGNDGTATAVASGGTAPYTYAWAPGGQTTATATGLTAGTYTVTITDAAGCTKSATTTVGSPACNLTASASAGTIACLGGTTTLTVTTTGGTAPLQFSLNGGAFQSSNTFTVGAGTYTVTAKDASNCTITTNSVTVTQPTSAITASASAGTIACFGGTTTLTVTATGGTGALQYSLNGGALQSGNTFTVGAGSYSVSVTDANGCIKTVSGTVTQPATLVANSSAPPISSPGGSTTVTVSASGGTSPYTGTGNFVRSAGTYTFTVTDSRGCTKTTTITLTDPVAGDANAAINLLTQNSGVVNIGGTQFIEVTINNTGPSFIPSYKVRAQIDVPSNVTISASGHTLPSGWSIAFNDGSEIILCNGTDNILANSARTILIAVQGVAIGGPSTISGTLTFGDGSAANGCNPGIEGILSGDVPFDNGSTTTIQVVCNATAAPVVGTITQPTCTVTTGSVVLSGLPSGNWTINPGNITGSGSSFTVTGLVPATYNFTVTDANGCTSAASADVVINAPTPPIASASAGTIACFGGTTTLTVTATGGTGALQYSLNGGAFQSGNTFTVGAGTYTVVVKDANNCTATTNAVTVTQPAVLVASSSATAIACNGGSSTVTVSATGGTAPYTGTGTFSRTAGTYSFTVTDANGCTAATTITIAQPAAIAATATSTPVTTIGGSDGTATVTASGGTAPYTYSWAPGGQTTATATGLTAGIYTVTVTDAAGCTKTATTTVGSPGCNISAIASAGTIACFGGSTTLTVAVTGGTAPFQYSLNGGAFQSGNTFTIGAGTYTVTVKDAVNCTVTSPTLTVTQPAQLVASSSATAIACNGGSSTVTVSATGGTAPYTGTGTFSRTAGTYTFTVTDAKGCTAVTTITITQPTLLVASSSATPIACFGGSSTVTVSATGGTAPYTGTGTFSRTAGTYTFTVTDAKGCTAVTTITIAQPTAIVATATSTPVTTIGGNDGTATVTASGGTAPYTYAWAPGGQTTATATGLTAGSYTVTVTDANGCTKTATTTVGSPACNIVASASAGTISCNGGTTTLTVTVTGGTAPLQYSLNGGAFQSGNIFTVGAGTYTVAVKDANNCTATTNAVTVTQPALLVASSSATAIACNGGSSTVTVSATGGTAPYTGTGTFSRTAGTYSFTVTDAKGCTAVTSITITQPTLLVASSSATAIACNGGSSTVTVSATGGTAPYTGTGTFSRTAGTYTFTVTDAKGCTAVTTITITQPTLLVASSSATAIACNGGSSTVTVSATGGTGPYTGTGTFSRTAGTYTITVTDANGCTAVTTITITQPTALTATASSTPATSGSDGTATVTATGGTAPYTYLWAPGGQTTATATGLAAGAYTVTVTDANGCTATATTTVTAGCGVVANAGTDKTLCPGGTVILTGSATGGSTSTTPPPQAFTEVSGSTADKRIFSGNIDQITIGNTFSVNEAGQSCLNGNCGQIASTSKTLTLPAGAIVKKAYLYWSGSGNLDNQVKLNGTSVTADGTKTYTQRAGYKYFAARKDVTSMVTASGTYTVNDLTWNNGSPYCSDNSAYGGWAMTVVYELASLPSARIHVNTEKFQFTYPANTYSTTINNISVPAGCSADAKLTLVAFEGDNYKDEKLRINNVLDADPNNFRGQSGPNLDIITKNAPSIIGGTTSLTYSIQSYTQSYCGGSAIEGLFDYVKVLKYNNCPSGGCNNYTYAWKKNGVTVGTTQSITVNTPGTYVFSATNCANCTGTDETVVTASTLTATATVGAAINCYSGTTTVTVAATGGTAPYTGTGTFTKGAGTWNFTVTDAAGCSVVKTVTIAQPAQLVATATAPQIPCGGTSTTVTVSASGGTAPYTGTGTFSRGNGTWSFTVTDSKGCTATATVTVTTASCGPVDPNKCYKLVNRKSGKVLSIEGCSTSSSAKAQQQASSSCQTFKFVLVETGFYEIINVNSGKALDVNGASTADNANVIQYTYGGGNNQKWSLTPSSSYFVIKAKHSGKAMSVKDGSTSNGAYVVQKGTGSNTQEQWQIVEVACPAYLTREAVSMPDELSAALEVTAMPNPSTTDFTLIIKSNDHATPVSVRILDGNGKLLSVYQSAANSTMKVGAQKWTNGIYLAEVIQGGQRKVVKLIKAN